MFNDLNNVVPDDINNLDQSGSGLAEVATQFANIAIIVAAGLTLISLAFAFVMIMTGGNDRDPKVMQKAWRAVTWSVIALIVSMSAWALKGILFGWLGVSELP